MVLTPMGCIFLDILASFFIWSADVYALNCPSAIFAFGDSLTDTGNYNALYPSQLGFNYQRFTLLTTPLDTSSSNTSSKRPFFMSNKFLPFRSGDGRLVIDFLAEAFGFPFLSANYRSGQDFSHGVNYAVSAATARDTAITVPYYLSVQIGNFIQWKGKGWVPSSMIYGGLFFIFIGLNDIWINANKYTPAQLKSIVVPDAVTSINKAIYNLYANGAKQIMVVGIPAAGCLPSFMYTFGTGNPSDYDLLGCLSAYNDAAKTFNYMLYNTVQNAQANMMDSTVLFADFYQLHLDAIAFPAKYGLSSEGTKNSCCANGNCCSNPYTYITWDGLYFTDGFNRIIATNFLKGYYVQDGFSLTCNLDFSNF